MDYSGRIHYKIRQHFFYLVSILLYQWITLEAKYLLPLVRLFLRFNPSVSMDYSGRTGYFDSNDFVNKSFNPSVSMDYSGRVIGRNFRGIFHRFQSFCINGLLWKRWRKFWGKNTEFVSILLYQWITLEAFSSWKITSRIWSFNPSVSMDYSGRSSFFTGGSSSLEFQSFCINGLLWKRNNQRAGLSMAYVSILLYQWITLEEPIRYAQAVGIHCVSILLYQWITLEVFETFLRFLGAFLFQSFCINGLLWKNRIDRKRSGAASVSILLYQWITLEVGMDRGRETKIYVSNLLYQWITLEVGQLR